MFDSIITPAQLETVFIIYIMIVM